MPRALEELIGRARRRWRRNLALAQLAHAAAVAAGGLVLLLLAGTQVLDWRWLAALLAVSLAWGFRRAARKLPSLYQVAQAVDRNLGLHDALSTAYIFALEDPQRKASSAMRAAQRAAAEALCPQVDVHRALPWRAPRALYLAAALAVAAAALFSVRYGVSRRLDLARSLPKIVLDTLRPPVERQAAKGKPVDRRLQEYWRHFGVSLEEPAGAEDRLAPAVAPEGESGRYSPEGVRPLEMSVSPEDQEASDEPGDLLVPGLGQEPGQQSGAARPTDKGRPDSDSLLEKFRDAFASLLNKLKIQPKGADSQQASASPQAPSETAQGRQSPTQRGMPGSGKELSEGGSEADAQQMQASEGGQKSSNAPGRRGREGENEASREGRSGIGREEGSKELREAEQLAAMEKISELIGRRSQTLTGEVMVEVTSGKQQLRTAYSQQAAPHAEAGGEIHRDEIPLAYHSYVERYFEQVRKLSEPAPRKK